jgi:NTE family protein
MVSNDRLADPGPLPFRCDLPVSLALGAGGIRGLAHVGVLDVLQREGFQVTEIVGASVGALIATCYAAVGLTIGELASAGLHLRSRHILLWAAIRGAPDWIRRLAIPAVGIIPHYLARLRAASFASLHHGVERVGIVAIDVLTGELVLCHSCDPIVAVEDATRGAVAIPRVFPPRRCRAGARELQLADAGRQNGLPVDLLFQAPFVPAQVVAIDISHTPEDRACNRAKIDVLRRKHPHIPIAVVYPDTLGERTLVYTTSRPARLLACGRDAARRLVDGWDRPPCPDGWDQQAEWWTTAPRSVRRSPPALRS